MFPRPLHYKAFLVLIYLISNCSTSFAFVFPQSSSFAYVAALALPLDLVNKDVYFAFNFAANYGLPTSQTHKDFIEKWNLDEHQDILPNSVIPINGRNIRDIYNRDNFFKIFAEHVSTTFTSNGTACLLRTICEVSSSPLHENNGILGCILKILFMPSTSQLEHKIHYEFYNAELNGKRGICNEYYSKCPFGLLDLISTFL